MPFVTRNTLLSLIGLSAASLVAAGAFVWSGYYNMGADDPHTRLTHRVLETLRKRSIATRADKLQVPDLQDPARIRQGAGNYDAMCMGCHLAPGMAGTELSRGLYPAPPNLTRATVDAAAAFWVIKHGIKASGMPAWGRSMGDEYIWNMTAFLQVLPTLSPAEYQSMVDASGGHEHGGGETTPHAHPEGTPADHHDAAGGEASPNPPPADEGVEHRHADGTVESHPAPPTRARAAAAMDTRKPAPAATPNVKAASEDEHAGMAMPTAAPQPQPGADQEEPHSQAHEH